MWPTIPADAIAYIRAAFHGADVRVCETMLNNPNERETTLDGILVDSLIPHSAPTQLGSGAVVEMDIHNIGGLRRLYGWEVADIGVLVFVYRGSTLLAQKAGFLQSKRLYPKNKDVKDSDPIGFTHGMNAMLWKPQAPPSARLRKTFDFDDQCIYGALQAGDEQIEVLKDFDKHFGGAVYYLLYAPPTLPITLHSPQSQRQTVSAIDHGSRVLKVHEVHAALNRLKKGQAPTHASLVAASAKSYWPIAEWASDLLLTCKVGKQYSEDDASLVRSVIERRTGPISAAIAVSISLADD